jgi:hypothetical protein
MARRRGLMNIARMLKWVWKLYQNDQTIWTQLIRAKYHAGSDIFFTTGRAKGQGGSQF